MKPFKLYHRITPKDPIIDYVISRGGDPSPIRELMGQNLSLKEQKLGYVPWTDICMGLERAAEILGDPYFGLKYGMSHRDDYRVAGPMVFLLGAALNIRSFIDTGIKYQALHTNAIHYTYEEDPENQEMTGVFTFHPMSGAHRQIAETLLVTLCEMGRSFLPDINIKRVTFQHRAPDDLTWYKTAFEAPVTFNAERTTIATNLDFLDMERSSFLNDAIQKSLKIYLDRKLKQHSYAAKSIAGSVVEVLPSLMGVRKSGSDHVARSLGMHPKKLQRLLRDEGTHYKNILDEVRRFQAMRLLEDTDMSIEKTAQLLDYASGTPFNAACKRWFDMSPVQYRKATKPVNASQAY